MRSHVLRESQPPWRTSIGLVTECGKPIEVGPDDSLTHSGHQVYRRAELAAFVQKHGDRRAVILICVTCYECCRRWEPWQVDPVSAMHRETNPVGSRAGAIKDELLALADLVANHQEEYESLLHSRKDTVDFRQARRERAARGAKNGGKKK